VTNIHLATVDGKRVVRRRAEGRYMHLDDAREFEPIEFSEFCPHCRRGASLIYWMKQLAQHVAAEPPSARREHVLNELHRNIFEMPALLSTH
jgi:hypothetical protein